MTTLALAVLALASPQTAPKETPAEQMLKRVNELRAAEKLAPLSLDKRLNEAAERQVSYMLKIGKLTHRDANNRGIGPRVEDVKFPYLSAGENVASGYETVQECATAWMKTEGHRKNILDKNYTHMGLHVQKSAKGRLYWCQVFAQKAE